MYEFMRIGTLQTRPWLCVNGLHNHLLCGYDVGFLWLEDPSIHERPVARVGIVRLESRTISDADSLFRYAVPLASEGQGKRRLLIERRKKDAARREIEKALGRELST